MIAAGGRRRSVALALLAVPVLIAAAALLHLSVTRQSLQRSVDSAAQNGARALAARQDPRRMALRILQARGVNADARSLLVVSPIPDGRFAGQPQSVRVRLATGWRLPFAPFLPELPLEVRAASAVVPRELVASATPVVLRIE